VDGDDIARFRENLKRLGIPFHVERRRRSRRRRLERGRPPGDRGLARADRRADPAGPALPGLLVTRVLHLLKGDDVELLSSVLASSTPPATSHAGPPARRPRHPPGSHRPRVPKICLRALLERIFRPTVVTW
jgi:hypothetical protein